jgi:NADPH:quinone reductase-like Zn-dependent oxidoreductase
MKAVYINEHGGPEVLTYGDRTEPVIRPNEVKVRVRACALNRLDLYTRSGARGTRRTFRPPLILGGDASGEVVEVGNQVRSLKVGDRVVINPRITCGTCRYCLAGQDDLCVRSVFMGTATDGSYAELVMAPEVNAHVIATDVTYEQAAAVPTTFLPVWNILGRKGQLKPWETVLVLSASAGVGTAAIQVAKKVLGARVIATTSTSEKADKARAVGADEVIVYTQEDIVERVKELTNGEGVDMVLDHVGAEFFPKAFEALRKGGRYGVCGVTTGYQAQLHMGEMFTKGLHLFGVFMGSKEDMRQVVAMLNQGKIRPVVDRVFPLSQAADAHRLMESRQFFGKIVLRP